MCGLPLLSLLSFSLTHTLYVCLSLSHTHTHTHIISLSHTHYMSVSLSLTHTHTHYLSLSLTLPHTRTLSSFSLWFNIFFSPEPIFITASRPTRQQDIILFCFIKERKAIVPKLLFFLTDNLLTFILQIKKSFISHLQLLFRPLIEGSISFNITLKEVIFLHFGAIYIYSSSFERSHALLHLYR